MPIVSAINWNVKKIIREVANERTLKAAYAKLGSS